MIVVGIDLGVAGAVAAVDGRGSAVVHDLPVIPEGDIKRLDGRAFIHMLRGLVPPGFDGEAMVAFEDIRVRSKMNGRVTSQSVETTLVGLRFAVQCACDIARMPVKAVQPQQWMRHFALKRDKNGTVNREMAMRLYPSLAAQLGLVKWHNRADAILIAHYCQSRFA